MPDLSPIHPGEVLSEAFIKPMGLSAYRVAQAAGVSQTRLSQIIRGKRSVTPETALRLGAALGTTAEFWLNLQSRHDLETARRLHGDLTREVEKLKASTAA